MTGQPIHRVARTAWITSVVIGTCLQQCSTAPGTGESTGEPPAPTVEVATVTLQPLHREVRLPGELAGYKDVAVHPKVEGFVKELFVDRGSEVTRGDLLLRLEAPELTARRSEAEARTRSARAQFVEAQARLAASQATYDRLQAAAQTPGVVAGNDLEGAQRMMEADRARTQAWEENEKAARGAARAVQNIAAYLRVTAPFDGVITERNVHEGSLVGPAKDATAPPMLRIQQISRLRLTIFVPETDVSGIVPGTALDFTVPAYPGARFRGVVRRIAHALDVRTRTMPIELDVDNTDRKLAPGMYAEVSWIVRRSAPSLFVPPSSVATTTERTFVIRIDNGLTEWVDVKRGSVMGDRVEVFGDLAAGDVVALRGTDELRAGTRVSTSRSTAGE